MGLSPRTLIKCKKTARTIADMEGSQTVEVKQLAEAVQYRETCMEKIDEGMY